MYMQRYQIQTELPWGNGKTKWETSVVRYVSGHTATETVASVRSQSARWIRYYRNQVRAYGQTRRFRMIADVPSFSPAIVGYMHDDSPMVRA